jgi:hypothetical protein
MMGTEIMTGFHRLDPDIGSTTNCTGIAGVILHPGCERDVY